MVTTTARPAAQQAPSSTWAVAAVVGTIAVFAGIVAWSVHSGAIHRAYSDDWGYLRIAERFVHDGRLQGVGWNDTALLGQLLASKILAPITGSSVAGLRLLNILCAAGSLVLVSYLARKTRARWLWAVVPLALVVMIGFGSTITTYMTEQAALVAQLGTLALGVVAWQRWDRYGRLPYVYLGAVGLVGLWGGSIRQAAIVAPLAVLGTLASHPRAGRTDRRLIVAVAAGVVVSVLLLQVFTPLSGPTMAIVRGSVTGQVARMYQAAATLGLFLTPVAILTGWFGHTLGVVRRWSASGRGRIALALLGLLVVAGGLLLHHRDGSLLVGNSLQQAGGYQGTDVAFPKLFDPFTWTLVEVLAAAALFLLLVLALDALQSMWWVLRRRGPRGLADLVGTASPMSRMTAAWTVLSMLGALAVNFAYRAIYDRYLIPVVIGLALLALDNCRDARPSRRHLTMAAIAFVPLLLLGALSATDSQDLLELRWAGGDRLVALGYQPATIDAGFDWVGYHYPGEARPDQVVVDLPSYPPATYDVFFPGFVRCAFVSGDPVAPPGYTRIDQISRHRLFGIRTTTAYLFGSTDGRGTCPPIGR